MKVEIQLHSFLPLELDGLGGQRLTHALYPWEGAPVPILQESGWSPGPVGTDIQGYS